MPLNSFRLSDFRRAHKVRRTIPPIAATVCIVAAATALAGCSKDSIGKDEAAAATTAGQVSSDSAAPPDPSSVVGSEATADASPATVVATPPTPTVPPSLIPADAPFSCPPVEGSSLQRRVFPSAGLPMCIDSTKQYRARVVTNLGEFVIKFDAVKAPKTVNNFVTLARYKYFDGISFHRVVPGFVIQGGDPDGNGSGGPGYEFADELPGPGEYKVGSVAMANAGPNTNGSQFFLITGPDGAALPPNYTLFGEIVEGMETVNAIAALGIGDGPPSSPAGMISVTIEQS